MYNCPNCGAPRTGDKCEYCGTVFRRQEPTSVLFADGTPIMSAYEDGKIAVLPDGVEYDHEKHAYKFYEIMSLHDIMSPNEMREAVGLPPIEPTKRDEK